MKKLQILIIVLLISLSIFAFANMQVKAQTVNLSQFVFSEVSSPQTAGKAFSITITAKASNGNTVTSYTGTNTLTVSSGTISPTGTTAFVAGVWAGQVTLSQAGTGFSISTSGGGKSGKSNTFTVNPGALDRFVFNTISSPQTASKTFSTTITAKDANSNTVTSYTGTNTLTVSSGTISPTGTSAFVAGIWTGSVSISASGSGITIGTSGSSKSGTSNSFTVNAVILDHFVFNAISSPQTAGSVFSITITAKTPNGNTVTSYTGTPILSVSTGTISSPITGAFSSGVWTGAITATGVGSSVTITVTDGTHSGSSNSFTVNPGFATHIVVSNGASQVAGNDFSVTVTAKDAYGNTATGYAGMVKFTSSDNQAVLPSNYAFQASDAGVHSFNVTLETKGSQSITATDTANSAITGFQTGITVAHAATASSVILSPAASSVTAGLSKTYSATAFDAYGNSWDVTSSTTWSISSDSGSSWNSNIYTSATAGSWIVTGSYASAANSTGLTVNPAGLDHFIFNIVETQTAGSAFSIAVTAKDAYNNTVTGYSGTPSLTFSAGLISPTNMTTFLNGVGSASVSVTAAGLGVTITVTDGTHTGTSNSFTVNPTISASAGANGTISPSGSVSVNYGSSQSFNIRASTGYQITDVIADNVSLGAISSYTFTAVLAAHTITANFAINTFNITASAGDGGSISPNGSVNVNYGNNQSFTVTENTGYYIFDVLVNGSSVGAVSSYTFSNVQAAYTILATFAPTPTPSPSPTGTPSPAPTPTPKPTPTPTPIPLPTSSPTVTPLTTTVPASIASGATVNIAITGNITSSQISNATITSYQPTTTTTISFTITGPSGTVGFGNMTIPKNAVSYGKSPVVYINGQQALNQGYKQDSNNFYVWYTTHFSTHQVKIQFAGSSPTPSGLLGPVLAVGITVPEIILIFSVIAVRRLRRKPENA